MLLLVPYTLMTATRHGLAATDRPHVVFPQSLLALKQLEANMRREELLFSQLGVDFFLNVRTTARCRCVFAPCEL